VSLALVAALVVGSLAVIDATRTGNGNPAAGGGRGEGPATPVELLPGQYLYMRQTLAYHGGTFSTETWWATDGSGRMRITCSTRDCVTDTGPGYLGAYGSPGDETFAAGKFPVDDDPSGLSTDPDTLRQQLVERTAPSGASPEPVFSPGPELAPGVTVGSVLYAIENLLNDPNGDPAVKAAVFQVAGGLEGVQTRTGGTDPVGRPATVLIFPGVDGGPASNWYFDPASYQFMGNGPANGTKLITVEQGSVVSTDVTPTGDQWFFPPAP
jgi:hypothetical protein